MRLSNRTCGHVADVAPATWRHVAASPARCGILKVQLRSRILPCVTRRVKKRAGLWGSLAEWRDIQPRDPSACWNHLTRPTHRLFRQCGRPPGVKVKAKRNCPKPAFHSFNTQKVPFRIKYLARRVYDWQVVTGGLFLLLLLLCLAEANQNLPISSTLQCHNLPCVTTSIYLFFFPSSMLLNTLSTVWNSSQAPRLPPQPPPHPPRSERLQIRFQTQTYWYICFHSFQFKSQQNMWLLIPCSVFACKEPDS